MDNKKQVTHNPDVLCCLANLSNDEVFTPPQLANEVLDLLPKEIWSDPTITFLDPCCKTGVFLREITIRLIEGLKDEIPDLQERINHILTKQVFGIAITELTALMTRRTLYCSKEANGKYSVCTDFGHSGGNIYYNPNIKHEWEGKTCNVCGASKELWERETELESHAYAFIHKKNEELFHMKFDVIIGNPPYQLTVSSKNNRAVPLYHKFIEKAISLNPKYITMIIPSRWLTGGDSELKRFRNYMLNDKKINTLVDFEDANDCFSGVDIKGGVCYFLWDKNHYGQCETITFKDGKEQKIKRNLLEDGCDIFIRDYQAISILHKILAFEEDSFSSLVSAQKPFGVPTNFQSEKKNLSTKQYKIFGNNFSGFINSEQISKNQDWIGLYKLFIPKAIGSGNTKKDWVKPLIGLPDEVCTETYVVVSPSKNKSVIKNVLSYTQTKFFHFMLGLKKNTQDALRGAYQLVPLQDFSKPWTDQELYEKYGLTQEEIDYIESIVRPMDSKED